MFIMSNRVKYVDLAPICTLHPYPEIGCRPAVWSHRSGLGSYRNQLRVNLNLCPAEKGTKSGPRTPGGGYREKFCETTAAAAAKW